MKTCPVCFGTTALAPSGNSGAWITFRGKTGGAPTGGTMGAGGPGTGGTTSAGGASATDGAGTTGSGGEPVDDEAAE